jgi:hypothetical protein
MLRIAVVATLLLAGASQAWAGQEPAPGTPPPPPAQSAPPTPSDRAVDPLQPDFTLIGLPTNLRMPKYASAFRVTHRFTRPLGQGDFSDLLGDAFGIDGGAQIGLEYRFGLRSGTQIGIHRTSDRTIEFFGQQQVLRQNTGKPVTMDILAAIEGTNNFRDEYSPSIGLVISRTVSKYAALYAQPIFVGNTNLLPNSTDDNDTFIIGVGARLRVRPTVYAVVEAAPRFGFDPSHTHFSFAIEKRAGGHLFQINFSNSFATTLGPIARGGFDYDTWFLGFNISRKFF